MDQNSLPTVPVLENLKEAIIFLQGKENFQEQWNSLSYLEVLNFVKTALQNINSNTSLDNASIEELAKEIDGLLSNEEKLQSVVPQNLQALILEMEEARGKAKIFEQKAANRVRKYLKELEKQKPPVKITERIISETIQEISQGIPESKQDFVTEAIVEELITEYSTNATDEEILLSEDQLQTNFQEIISSAITKLNEKGVTISPEEEIFLSRIPLPVSLQFSSARSSSINLQRERLHQWIKGKIQPVASPEETVIIANIFAPVIAEKLEELNLKNTDLLPEQEFLRIKSHFERIVTAAVTEAKTNEHLITKINKISSFLIPQNKKDLKIYERISGRVKERIESFYSESTTPREKSFFSNISSPVSVFSQQGIKKTFGNIFSTFKTGIKAITSGIFKKVGLHAVLGAVTGGIGNVLLLAVPKLFKAGHSLFKKTIGGITSGFGIFDSILGGLTGQNEVPENKDLSFLAPLFIGMFALLLFLPVFVILFSTSGALVQEIGSGDYLGEVVYGPPTYPDIQCNPSRHLAEEIVCRLTQKAHPCDQGILDYNTRDEIRACIDSQADFPQKDLFRERLYNFNCYFHKQSPKETRCPYECLMFVNLITQALGQNFNGSGSAGDYYNSPPPNYIQVTNLKGGEVVVWPGSPGHIAIYLGSVPDSKTDILIAEANTNYDGRLRVGIRPNTKNGMPVHFFRYCPEGNCQ